MRIGLVLCLWAGLLLAIAAYGARYDPPPLGRLVLDAVLDPAADGHRLPLRLPRTGRYYAELSWLHADAAAAPLALDLRFTFRRGEDVLAVREVALELRPERPIATLFWLEVPRDLPEHRRLALEVARTAGGVLRETLRLQLTRKAELLPHPPR